MAVKQRDRIVIESEKMEDGGSEIDVATRKVVQHRAMEAGTGRDQGIVHIKFAEGGVAAFASAAS